VTLVLLFLLMETFGFAQVPEVPEVPPEYPASEVEAQVDFLSYLNGATALSPDAPESCTQSYQNFLNRLHQQNTIDIRVFVGYLNQEKDGEIRASDWVKGNYISWSLAQFLMTPCKGSLAACGFTIMPEALEQKIELTKSILDLSGQKINVRVTIENASLTNSDKKNRHELKREQRAWSKQIARDFLESLWQSDVVIYNGHARHGTGPGFKALPVMGPSWVTAGLFRPSRHGMLLSLKKSQSPPQFFGYFACGADKYYEPAVEKASPSTAMALPVTKGKLLVPSTADNSGSVFGTINALLGFRCEDDFKKSLLQGDVSGFFKND
jgi:hypothetical protein